MADLEFRNAVRAWKESNTSENKHRVVNLARRQGMDFWQVFEFMLGCNELFMLHQAIKENDPEEIKPILFMLAEELAPQETNIISHSARNTGDGDWISGTTYIIGYKDYENRGVEYILEDNSERVYLKGPQELHLVHDQNIIDQVLNLYIQDVLIEAARNYIAEETSGGDPDLRKIYEMNIAYNRGKLSDPTFERGIPFFKVGGNASHTFYYGYKDGQLYKMAEEYDYNESGQPYPLRDVYTVEGFGGYSGHFRRNPYQGNYRKNSDSRLRSLERQVAEGDTTMVPHYMSELIRTGRLDQRNVIIAAALGHPYSIALAGDMGETPFCLKPPPGMRLTALCRGIANRWGYLSRKYGFTAELILAIADYFLGVITAPSSDAYFHYIQLYLGRLEKAYQTNSGVSWDGGIIQELQYSAEGNVSSILGFVFNACEYFEGKSIDLDHKQLDGFANNSIYFAIHSVSDISFGSFCKAVQSNLINRFIPELCI